MKIIIAIFYICVSFLYAKDTLVVQQQNVLYVQNLIDIEEKIAENFEKYLLEEYSIPSIDDLKTDEYLGSNFTTTNKFGASTDLDISFVSTPNLKINYAITKDVQLYVSGLYKRDLYRDMTTVYEDTNDSSKSYVSFELKSKVAENIFDILKSGASIADECSAILTSTYCVTNLETIRWYDTTSRWIEYNNEDFENGNVTLSTTGLLTNSLLDNLTVGSFVFINNGDKYVKTSTDIVKVD
ncbi:MAG: hypothetical protein CL624_10400 [Arcobacter sp.]|nr:hypothetical protein [Arcobacter sp.]|tara:strand:+ start:3787 stop:4506 length:720 start_codon:yes stop_codon:yes gene_type:complete